MHYASFCWSKRVALKAMDNNGGSSSDNSHNANMLAATIGAIATALVESPVELFRHRAQAGGLSGSFIQEMVTTVQKQVGGLATANGSRQSARHPHTKSLTAVGCCPPRSIAIALSRAPLQIAMCRVWVVSTGDSFRFWLRASLTTRPSWAHTANCTTGGGSVWDRVSLEVAHSVNAHWCVSVACCVVRGTCQWCCHCCSRAHVSFWL